MFLAKYLRMVKEWLPILKTVTVEPAAFLLMTSVLMSHLCLQDLMLERVCTINLGLDKDVCQSIVSVNATFAAEESAVQKVTAEVRAYRSLFDHSLPIIFILFFGPWSDIYGRKIPMLSGIFGFLLQACLLIACSLIESVDGYSIGLIAAISKSIFGGELAYTMAAYSYIADRTDPSVRTVRTGLLSAAYGLGVPMGFVVGGAVSKAKLGAAPSFAISAVLSATAFFIILITVKNNKPTQDKVGTSPSVKDAKNDWNWKKEGQEEEGAEDNAVFVVVKSLILNIFKILFTSRENNQRCYLWLLLISHICVAAPIHGEFGVMYLFLRGRLQWDAGDYGYFSMYNFFIGIIGVIISMGLLSHHMKLSDPVVGFIAGMSQFAGCIIYAVATNAILMFIAPTVDMLNGTMHVITRSMISKLVLPTEVGLMFTIIAILDSLVPLAFDPVYSTIYRLTLDYFSGTFFILSAALTVPPQLIYLYFILKKAFTSESSNEIGAEPVGIGDKGTKGVMNEAFSENSIDKKV